jgi:subtilisin family serine protease
LNDPFSHGTHTAGTVAAADNGVGTMGVAPEATLILVKVLPDAGCGGDGPILQGLMHAAGPADADVISLSLGAALNKHGYLEPGCSDGPEDDVWVTASEVAEIRHAYQRAVQYATSQGATVIASAGNEANDGDHDADQIHLPSDTPGVLSISATAPIGWATDPSNAFLDYPASYTNFGQSVIDFAAPGGDFVYPGEENCTVAGLTRPCWVFDLVFSTGSNLNPAVSSYYWSAGTSMAAPHVAGVAAIIIGANGGEMKPSAVEKALRASADDLGKPGNDDFYGAGRVNAANAVD